MIIDAHAFITPGMHGRTRVGPTRSLPYGRIKQGDQVVQMLPPLSAEKMAMEPETMLRMMDWVGIDKMVLMQSPFFGDQNTFLHQAAHRWPDRFLATAYLDPRDRQAHDTFRRISEDYGFRILTFDMSEITGFLGLYPNLQLQGEELSWYWEQAERLGMVVVLNLGRAGTSSYQTETVKGIAERYTRMRIVIAHLAHPPLADPENEESNSAWQEQIILGRYENVWFDVAGLPALGVEDYPFPRALRYIRQAAEIVGAEKLIWGSEIPTQLCQATYPQLLNMLALHSGLDDEQLGKVLGETASQVYLNAAES